MSVDQLPDSHGRSRRDPFGAGRARHSSRLNYRESTRHSCYHPRAGGRGPGLSLTTYFRSNRNQEAKYSRVDTNYRNCLAPWTDCLH